jgi:hypothetical protein
MAQESNVVSVDISKFSPEVQHAMELQLKANNAQTARMAKNALIDEEIDTYVGWAGKGSEIRDALMAVKDVTLELADSEVGQVTIWLVIWEYAGKDVIRISIGLMLLIISSIVVITSYFRTFKNKILVKGGWNQPKEWKSLESNHYWMYPNAAALSHLGVWLGMIAVSAMIMFGLAAG